MVGTNALIASGQARALTGVAMLLEALGPPAIASVVARLVIRGEVAIASDGRLMRR
jgi:hypothetical protein